MKQILSKMLKNRINCWLMFTLCLAFLAVLAFVWPGWAGEAGAVTEDWFDPPVGQNATAKDDHGDEDEYEEWEGEDIHWKPMLRDVPEGQEIIPIFNHAESKETDHVVFRKLNIKGVEHYEYL